MKFNALPPLFLLSLSVLVQAASPTLPAPSRTLYRCEVNGLVSYSDTSCLGAQKLTVEPTRAVNESTGRELVGKDVRHENHREAFADAVRPTTGMDARQYDVHSKRTRLEPKARAECQSLDHSIASLEDAEREAKYLKLREIQKDLLFQRQRFHELGC